MPVNEEREKKEKEEEEEGKRQSFFQHIKQRMCPKEKIAETTTVATAVAAEGEEDRIESRSVFS